MNNQQRDDPKTPLSAKDEIFDTAALWKEAEAIWSMAWKVSLATFCRISLSTISTAFLGHIGSKELAASALAGIWTGAVQVIIYGFAVSLCTLCGQAYGAKNYELVGMWLQLALIFLTILSIPVCISFFYVDQILSFIIDDQELLALANTFAKYSALSIWPQCIYCALRQYFQAQEIVSPATIISVLSVFICIISNYVFIYGFMGIFPPLGYIGSPLAQFVSSLFQPVALLLYAGYYKGYHKQTWYGFTWRSLHPDRVRRFVGLSLGMTVNLALDEWVYNVVSSIAGILGPVNLAANSVLYNLWGLIFGVFWGFGLPTQVRTANFLGANQPNDAKRTLYVGFTLGALSAFLSAVFVYSFSNHIVAIFTPDIVVGAIIINTLPIFCTAVFISGLHIILAAVVEAMSLATTLVFITGCGSWLVLLPFSYLFGIVLNEGLRGLWLGSILGESTKFIMMSFALYRIDWVEMALNAVKQSEGVMDDEEMESEIMQRVGKSICMTPTMKCGNASPVIGMLTSTPQQVRPSKKYASDEKANFPSMERSYSYGSNA